MSDSKPEEGTQLEQGTSLWIDLEQQVSIVLLTSRQHLVAKRSQFSLRPLTHDLIREAFLAA